MKKFVRASGGTIMVPPGIALRATIEGSLPVDHQDVGALGPSDIVTASFRLEYSTAFARYEIASFGLDRMESAAEITGALWRTVRVHSIARTGVELGLPGWTRAIPLARFRRRDGNLLDPPNYQSSDPDGLLLTALVYRIAEVTGENPALAVAETLGLKQRTATNWISRARASGFMASTEHGDDARRVANELSRRMPPGRPLAEEEGTAYRAAEIEVIRSRRELEARWRRNADGHD